MKRPRKVKEVVCEVCGNKETVYNSRAKNYRFCSKDCMSISFSPYHFNIGDKLNNWVIVKNRTIRKHGRSYIKVKCTCGSNIIKELPAKYVNNKASLGCRECSQPPYSCGYGKVSGEYFKNIKFGAKARNLSFEITAKDIWELFLKCNRKCSLTGIELELYDTRDKRSLRTASLDRIDSSKGYSLENVQWVHKDVNMMKNKYDQDYFIEICRLITEKNNEQSKN